MPAKWKKWNIIAGKGKVMGKEKKKEFEKLGEKVFSLSLYDDASVKNFRDELIKILKKK